jgi:glycine dehydrogenase subunit 1
MATVKQNVRLLPGRIVGKTEDSLGRASYVLTMQAREQHIRREKASSSICSNQAHCALRAAVYMATAGREGMQEVARACYSNAHYLAEEICKLPGFSLKYNSQFFNEFVIKSEANAYELERELAKKDILSGLPLSEKDTLYCVTEQNTKEQIDLLLSCLKEAR